LCFVLSLLLFNFQGPLPPSRFFRDAAGFTFYHIFSVLSRLFQNFFKSFFRVRFLSQGDLAIISQPFALVKWFCKLFQKTFFSFASLGALSPPRSRGFDIIPLSVEKVKRFFDFFRFFTFSTKR